MEILTETEDATIEVIFAGVAEREEVVGLLRDTLEETDPDRWLAHHLADEVEKLPGETEGIMFDDRAEAQAFCTVLERSGHPEAPRMIDAMNETDAGDDD